MEWWPGAQPPRSTAASNTSYLCAGSGPPHAAETHRCLLTSLKSSLKPCARETALAVAVASFSMLRPGAGHCCLPVAWSGRDPDCTANAGAVLHVPRELRAGTGMLLGFQGLSAALLNSN